MNVHLFQRILETLDDLLVLYDAQGRLVYVSPCVRHYLGFAPEELLDAPGADLLHPDDRRPLESFCSASPSEARTETLELRCRLRDGSYRSLRACLATLPDANEQSFVLLRLNDHGESKQGEGRAEEGDYLKATGRLAGGVAHEFNNLLTVITGYTCVLLDGHPLGDPDHEPLSHIQRAAERAAELVRQLLAVAGRQMLRPITIGINAIVLGLTEILQRLLGPSIPLQLNLDPSLPPIQVDPAPIGQVLLDLAANARDAMPAGGQFTLATTAVSADAVPPGMPPGPAVRLTATDTGRGMDEQTLRHLFEPFFTTKDVGEGTGLSLAAAYGIVKQCGGHLAVDSRPGAGTTFILTLPSVPPEEA